MHTFVLIIGSAIVVFGAALTAAGAVFSGVLTALFGLLIVMTTIWEARYRNRQRTPPGDGWDPTEERFVDPETGEVLQVWVNRQTGERTYVVAGEGKSV